MCIREPKVLKILATLTSTPSFGQTNKDKTLHAVWLETGAGCSPADVSRQVCPPAGATLANENTGAGCSPADVSRQVCPPAGATLANENTGAGGSRQHSSLKGDDGGAPRENPSHETTPGGRKRQRIDCLSTSKA
ncbi:hypothetical protein EYF80_065081 [Liparis tanakae]|uniref:Uncharacterized protein n=1 Tax=Liparis tanakae TaxID=230148 RepID=A0A4Z2E807_9TELE|nr:hypothetical protein EYF80_065081 [Liparis tanakae]